MRRSVCLLNDWEFWDKNVPDITTRMCMCSQSRKIPWMFTGMSFRSLVNVIEWNVALEQLLTRSTHNSDAANVAISFPEM